MKKLLVFFIAIGLLGSCEKEETSYALQNVSAPTNVKAIFNIAQDDTGTVTVTPTSVGATSYEVYFGDVENETAIKSAPGESISHVYAEGEYTLRIVAIGLTGLTSELSRVVVISFTPPTDLTAEIAISTTNPFEITVTPNATNATVYDIYFGDTENEEPTTIMAGENIKHSYAEAGEYTVRVVARGAGAATIEITQEVTISGNSDPIVLPITFDNTSVNYAFETFNGASFEVLDNPTLSGANTVASKVGAITNSGANWEGGAFNLGTPVDFSSANKIITMKFWSDVSLPILLKFEGGVNGERQNEVVATHGGTGWEVLSFDFAVNATKSYIDGDATNGEAFVPTGQYTTMVMFIDGPGTSAGTFYIDDIAKGSTVVMAAPQLPINFESTTLDYTWTGFGASDFGPIPALVIANPDKSGINTSNNVVEIHKTAGAQVWAGASLNLDGAIDFSTATTVNVKVWSPRAGTPILFKIEDSTSPKDGNGNPTVFVEIQAVSTTVGTWENLSFDLTSSAGFSANNSYDRVILFPDFGNAGANEKFYFDDILLGTTGGTGKTVFPVNFETTATGAGSTWDVFESDTPPLKIISNPDPSGINTSATVAEFTAKLGGANYAGTVTALETPFTLNASNSVVKIMVWKSVISDVGIKFESNKASTGEIKVANTKINEWEEITFDMSAKIGEASSTNIDAIVVFPDFNARTQDNIVYFDNITLNASSGGTSGNAPQLPINFESTTLDYTWSGFGSSSFEPIPAGVIANPDKSGINLSNNVVEIHKTTGAQVWAGASMNLDGGINWTSGTTVKVKVWSPRVGTPILFKIEDSSSPKDGNNNPTVFAEVQATSTVAGAWEELSFNLTSPSAGSFSTSNSFDRVILFPDFGNTGANEKFYFDDITNQ